MPKKVKALPSAFDNNTGVMMHRIRQTNFIKKCIPELRKRNATYVTLIDTDEFVLPSYTSWYFFNVTRQVPRYEPGNVLRLLKYHEQITGTQNPCLYMPRYFFGAQESPKEKLQKFVPVPVDAQSFITQRFIYREPKINGNGKNLINMKLVPKIEKFDSVHKITSVCPELKDMWKLNQNHHSIVRVHHYLGTTEQHFFRDDPREHNRQNATNGNETEVGSGVTTPKKGRKYKKPATYLVRGMERYERLNKAATHEDHGMLGWLFGFVKAVGWETAKELLEGVGVVGVE